MSPPARRFPKTWLTISLNVGPAFVMSARNRFFLCLRFCRGAGRAGRGGLHRTHRAAGHAALSRGGAAWRRVLVPIGGSLAMGYLLYRYFPNARGSGVPQDQSCAVRARRLHLPAHRAGKIRLHGRDAFQRHPLGREGPSVQVGAGIASSWDAPWDCGRKK